MNAPLLTEPADHAVVHNPEAQQFEVRLNGSLAVCVYHLQDGVLDIHHTEVPAALNGRGLAGKLVAASLVWAREQGLQVRPTCSYAAGYMAKHAETQDLLVR